MPFSVEFIQGSLAGRRFPVGPEGTTVGRSRSCGIRPKEPDVSGRHLVLSDGGSALRAEVLSSHRTVIGGNLCEPGSTVEAGDGTIVELGDFLSFRVIRGETDSDGGVETLLSASATMVPPPSSPASIAAGDAGTETLAEPSRIPEPDRVGETSLFEATSPRSENSLPGGGGVSKEAAPEDDLGGESSDGETQVLATQVASREELEQLRGLLHAKAKKRFYARFAFLGVLFAFVVGTTYMLMRREPEREFGRGGAWSYRSLFKADGGDMPAGASISIRYPTNAVHDATVEATNRVVTVETRIGRDFSTKLWIRAEWFESPASATEDRDASFLSFLGGDPDFSSCLDAMDTLPGSDFFGGRQSGILGYRHAVPCSRREYSRHDASGDTRWGVVSFFRNGTHCFVVRREVPEAERGRARKLLLPTDGFVLVDGKGLFSESQWEGAAGAGCPDPKARLDNCLKRLQVDKPAEWPDLEKGLRDVLVSADDPDDRTSALARLAELRRHKAIVWRQHVVSRKAVANDQSKDGRKTARTMDREVRGKFPDVGEEWGALARSSTWWK